MIAYAPANERNAVILSNLNRIIDEGIVIPRTDLEFYIQAGLTTGNLGVTERFITQAKQWYQYSRVIAAAEEVISRMKSARKEYAMSELRSIDTRTIGDYNVIKQIGQGALGSVLLR